MCVALREVSTFVCVYSVVCVFFIAFLTNFLCVLYSWTAKKTKNPVGGAVLYFPSMTQSELECRHLPNGHCLTKAPPKPGFSTRVYISLHIVFCTCNNISSKKSTNIVFAVTGPGCYVSCFGCGVTFENL